MESELFEGIGLTKGESKVYLALLKLGETTTGAIIQNTRMQKSAVYFCLERLLSNGLASFILKNNKKYFQASPPDTLIELLEKRKINLENQKEKVKQLMPKILALEKSEEKVQKVRFFTGWNGMQTAFEDILRTLKKGEDYHVFGVTTVPSVFIRFRRFIKKFHQKRAEKGINLRILVNEENRETIGKDRKEEKSTEVKFIPKEFSTPSVINIYGNKTLIAIWTEEPAAVVVENKETADSFRNYFKLIWKIAKK